MKINADVTVELNIKTGIGLHIEFEDIDYETWINMTKEEQQRCIEDYLDAYDYLIPEEIENRIYELDIEHKIKRFY